MISLNYVKNKRGLKFVKRGMRVEHAYDGKTLRGKIIGGNNSGNLNILFDGEKASRNCHPTWAMKYFKKDGSLIAEYPE